MKAKVISIDKVLFDGEVESVIVPGLNGEIEILSGHADSFFLLKKGLAKIESRQVDITGGFTKVANGEITVMTI